MKLVTVRGRPSVDDGKESTTQTGIGFSLEFCGLENTYLFPFLFFSKRPITAIFSVKGGKIHCWLTADLTKYCGEILFSFPIFFFCCKSSINLDSIIRHIV